MTTVSKPKRKPERDATSAQTKRREDVGAEGLDMIVGICFVLWGCRPLRSVSDEYFRQMGRVQQKKCAITEVRKHTDKMGF
jgi:hypothetical protein